MADDRELRISITTDAELAAMQKLRKEYAGMLRDVEKNSDASKILTESLKEVDDALESNTAKIIAQRKELEKILEAQIRAGQDTTATAEAYDNLGESAKEAGMDMSQMSNAAQVSGTLFAKLEEEAKKASNTNKAFGLSNRQLLRSLSGLLKATPMVGLAMRALAGPVGIAMAGFMALSMAVSKFRASSQKAEEEAKKLAETLEKPTVDAYKASSAASALAAAETAKMTDRLREQSEYFPTLAEQMAIYREQVKLIAEERAADLKQAHERELADLELLHEQKLISEDEYYKRSQALSLRAAEQKRQSEMEALQRQIAEKAEAIRISQAFAETGGAGLAAKRALLEQLAAREGGRVETTDALRGKAGALLGKGAGSIWALESVAMETGRAAARARETDPTGYFAKQFQKKADKAAEALQRARTELSQTQQEIAQRERDDRLKASTAADIARQEKRVAGAEDEADKLLREKAALEALIPLRQEAFRIQRERDEEEASYAAQTRLLQQNPAAMAMAREATGIMLGGRATGAQMAAVSVLGSPQALLAGGGSSQAMMAFAGGFVTRRQSLVSELNNPHTTPQRKTQIQKELDKLDAAAGVVGGSGAWTEDLARRLPEFSIGGYTGDGPKNEIAGVVHKGEIVIPADVVKRMPSYEKGSNGEPVPGWAMNALEAASNPAAIGKGAGVAAGTAATAYGLSKAKGAPSSFLARLKSVRAGINQFGQRITGVGSSLSQSGSTSGYTYSGAAKPAAAQKPVRTTRSMAAATTKAWRRPLAYKGPMIPTSGGSVANWAANPVNWARVGTGLARGGVGALATAALNRVGGYAFYNPALENTDTVGGALYHVGTAAAGGALAAGPAGAAIGAAMDFGGRAVGGVSDWSSAWNAAHASQAAVDSDTRLQEQELRKHTAAAQAKYAFTPAGPAYGPPMPSAAEAAIARANAAVASSYSFGSGGGQEGANYRADEAARRRASNPMADALRLRDARAGNTTGLEGPAAAAFYAQKMMEVMQAMSVTQSDADSRTKTARGAF